MTFWFKLKLLLKVGLKEYLRIKRHAELVSLMEEEYFQ